MSLKNRQSLTLLVNLGTPDAATPTAIRRYLTEFLHDYRVVDLSRWLWCLLLHAIILPLRAGRVAANYAKIWLPEGSPLAVYSQHLAKKLQQQMPHTEVRLAMRYGNPSIASVLAEYPGLQELTVLPLYPQYSATTSAAVFDAVAGYYLKQECIPHLRFIREYHQHPAWLEAIEARIRAHWDLYGRGEYLLFSFHGIPQRFAERGDPYPQQCQQSVDALARHLGLKPEQYRLTYQSRFGREPWLQPYTNDTLDDLAARGVKILDVVCPGFAVDCLETLEEIRGESAHRFQQAGGERLRYIGALNDEPEHVMALARILENRP